MSKFPNTNKFRKPPEEKVGDNIEILDELVTDVAIAKWLPIYWKLFGILLVSIFALIVVIRLALTFF